jgi:NAD(P)-dependent dehydrogenase (short-subunit alcohol dehydrogenase family)
MKDKIILITGASDGIGKQTAIELAGKRATVILHGKNNERLLKTQEEISKLTSNNNISIINADLSSLEQVRKAAEEIKSKFNRIDVLINNAGVYMKTRLLTEDGFETTFAVNHLAHFLLTNLLLELLKQSASSRIINVSSIAHTRAKLDFENLNSEKSFDAYNTYAVSKLANVLFTYKLADKLKKANIIVNAIHPGVISTKLLRAGFNINGASLKEGASTSVYLASSNEVENITGKYFVKMEETPSSEDSYNEEYQEKMWDVSSQMVDLD